MNKGIVGKIVSAFLLLASFSALAFEKEIPSIQNSHGFIIHRGENVLDQETLSIGKVARIWDTGLVERFEDNGPPNVHYADYLVPEVTDNCLAGICRGTWVINKIDHSRSKVSMLFADGTVRVLYKGLFVAFAYAKNLQPEEKRIKEN